MLLRSQYGGWCRNLWRNVDNGTITIHSQDEHLRIQVLDGMIVEETSRSKGGCTHLRYGRDLKIRENNQTVQEIFYEPGTRQAIRRGGLWLKAREIKLGGCIGSVEGYSTSSGGFAREIFTYNNGAPGYLATRWRSKLEILRPDGTVWIIAWGKVLLSHTPLAQLLHPSADDYGLWRIMRGPDLSFTVYEQDGRSVFGQGTTKSFQKQGKWIVRGSPIYFLSGIKVSRELYEEDPGQWNPYEVLEISNAQLRCSLLNRMGYDKLLEKVQPRIVDTGGDGGQLLEIYINKIPHSPGRLDSTMRMVKVICPSTGQVYVLRVPPDIERYDRARQWTFGLREESLRENVLLELIRET